jgi:hypothetical protein
MLKYPSIVRSKARRIKEMIDIDVVELCGIAPERMSDPLFRQAAMLSKARSDYLYMVVRLLVGNVCCSFRPELIFGNYFKTAVLWHDEPP